MRKTIKGKFEVEASPLPMDEAIETIGGVRMMFKNKFEGPLGASGIAAMLGIELFVFSTTRR